MTQKEQLVAAWEQEWAREVPAELTTCAVVPVFGAAEGPGGRSKFSFERRQPVSSTAYGRKKYLSDLRQEEALWFSRFQDVLKTYNPG